MEFIATTKQAVEWALSEMMAGSCLFTDNESCQRPSQQSQSHQQVPQFQPSDVEVGKILGMGNFGVVLEVSRLLPLEEAPVLTPLPSLVFPQYHNNKSSSKKSLSSQRKSLAHYLNAMSGSPNIMDYLDNAMDDDDDDETAETSSCSGHTDDTLVAITASSPRDLYALKRIKQKKDGSYSLDGTIDLACEALFLSRLHHANIIKCHGTVGNPWESSTYGIVLDRLRMTLKDQMCDWKQRRKQLKSFPGALLLSKKRRTLKAEFLRERLETVRDIAAALEYLHENRVAFRDLKPENVGYDREGTLKLFDFGMAKEFKDKDMVDNGSNGRDRLYNATGLAGSPLYMAPEVICSMPYGLSVDSYSFGILCWRVLALKRPYEAVDTNVNTLFDAVVSMQMRPWSISGIPRSLNKLMKQCWADDQRKRPTMKEIRQRLQTEILALN